MSWDAQQPAQPQGEPPQQQPAQPYQPTQPYQETQPYGAPPPEQPGYEQAYGQPTTPYPAYQYGPPADPGQQAVYGQPGPYDQQAPQWGGGGGGGYGGPYYPGYQPPQRNRTGFYVALGTVAVIVAAGVAVAVAITSSKSGAGAPAALGTSSSASASVNPSPSPSDSPSDSASPSPSSTDDTIQSPHTVIVPDSAGPLQLLSNDDTAQRITNIESGLKGNSAYSDPQIGFYTVGSDTDYSVWMLAETTTGMSVFQDSVNTLGDAGMARQIAQGAKMTDVTTESPGDLGGALLCGKIAVDNGNYRVCEWVDDSTFGWVYFMPSVSQDNILTYTLDLRDAAEQ